MFISNATYQSELFDTLSIMGLLCTEDKKIRDTKDHGKETFYFELELSYEDIEQVSYRYPHFKVDIEYDDILELWIHDEYINPLDITWIRTDLFLYGILNKEYDIYNDTIKAYYNHNIIQRYTNKSNSDSTLNHIFEIDTSIDPYKQLIYPERSVFYISQNKIMIPGFEWISDTTVRFSCLYQHDIDLFICGNLLGVYEAQKNIGLYIDNPNSKYCYHRILSDNDEDYTIDARFYPCIKVDRDCIIRVYDDIVSELLYPEVSRLVLYPEFLNINDPYNTTNDYLTNLTSCDEVITSTDADETIINKFKKISAYCFRVWEKFPNFSNEQPNYTICDNHKFNDQYFIKTTVYFTTESKECIITSAPVEDSRDVLFYNGVIFNDYQTKYIKLTSTNKYTETDQGIYRYVIPAEYNADLFTLIKFNTAEDSSIMNIGEYIDESNIVKLHYKLNNFYRNLLILRTEILDQDIYNKVRVSTTEPKAKDDNLWFQLLVNAVPEQFKTQSVDTINLYGLDANNIPDDIKDGAYALDLEPKDGPASYTDLLMTYFKLSNSQKNSLVLQYGEGIDDPRTVVYDSIKIGSDDTTNIKTNDVMIKDDTLDSTYDKQTIEYGTFDTPGNVDKTTGDLYLQDRYVKEEEPTRNEEFNEITYGPDENTPAPGDNPLWIDSTIDDLLTGITPQENESTTESSNLLSGITSAVNNNQTVSTTENPDAGTFALDNISFMDEATGTSIDAKTIENLSTDDKIKIIQQYSTNNTVDLSAVSPETLNTIVYRILLAAYSYDHSVSIGDLLIEGGQLPTASNTIALGNYLEDVKPDELFMQLFKTDSEGNVIPDYDLIKKQNIRYIMSVNEPIEPTTGDSWINIPAIALSDYVDDIVSQSIMETGTKLPVGYKDETAASTIFDYNANGKVADSLGEIFTEVDDQTLHEIKIGYPDEFPEGYVDDNVWYEFLGNIDNKICYSDESTIVININERLVLLQFDNSNITAYAFDDILLNFRGNLGIKYTSILADLINSNVIKQEDIIIFYNRMITFPDDFDLGLKRLYTETSHVVTTANIDTTDLSVLYSTNIGRFRMDYAAADTRNREREAAYRMCIDYQYRDFAFIHEKMLLFVNGKYIPVTQYDEEIAYTIHLHNFNEIISTVDILYNKSDEWLMQLKRCTYQYWQNQSVIDSIQRPNRDYIKMVPIAVYDKTDKGYYDILLNEYIFNGKLERILNYLSDHPDEYPQFRLDMIRHFHAIGDIDLSGMNEKDSRIILSGNGTNQPYIIE